jgi:hypothetical protein
MQHHARQPDNSGGLSVVKSRDSLELEVGLVSNKLPRFLETRIGGTLKFTWQSDRHDRDPGQC